MNIPKPLERWSPLILLAGILLIWEVAVRLLDVPDFIFPGRCRSRSSSSNSPGR